MNCPVCKEAALVNKTIEEELSVNECTRCGGHWFPSFEYLRWIEKHNWRPPEESGIEISACISKADSARGKLCPECGHILVSVKVGYGCEFFIDKCNHCAGMWLDKDEWEILKSRKLNDQLHYIFSSVWQGRVKKMEEEGNYREFLKTKLGEADFSKLAEFKQWMDSHAEKNIILSHLMNRR